MSKESFLCAVRGGEPMAMDSARWAEWMSKHEGALIYIHAEPNPRKRSSRQNAYYHAVVVPAVAEILESLLREPITKDDAHAWLKMRFLESRKTKLGEIPPSTADLSVEAMTDFINRIIQFFREHYDCHIPPASEVHEAA